MSSNRPSSVFLGYPTQNLPFLAAYLKHEHKLNLNVQSMDYFSQNHLRFQFGFFVVCFSWCSSSCLIIPRHKTSMYSILFLICSSVLLWSLSIARYSSIVRTIVFYGCNTVPAFLADNACLFYKCPNLLIDSKLKTCALSNLC